MLPESNTPPQLRQPLSVNRPGARVAASPTVGLVGAGPYGE
jgi:hypothetical protein